MNKKLIKYDQYGEFGLIHSHFHIRWIFIIICSISVCESIAGKNYYVDKYASGANNGTSWDNAWNSFSDIEWERFEAGDVLFISGGSDSTIYNESLIVGTNGNEEKLFTIRGASDSLHNGRVIIDVPDVGMKITNKKYLRVLNIEFKNVTSGVYIRGGTTGSVNVIFLDSLKVFNFKKQGGIFINGWSLSRFDATVDSVFIRSCILKTSYSTKNQTDGIYAQYCNNLFILNNTLTVTSTMKGSHTDVIQFVHNINNITIANNTINNLTSSIDNNKSNGIMGADLNGEGLFYNNIVYAPNFMQSGNNVFSYNNHATHDEAGSWYIYNNVFIGGGTVKLFSIEDRDACIKNNIFYSITPGTGQVFLRAPLHDWAQLDYNLYGENNGIAGQKIFNFYGGKTMSDLKSLGAEMHGKDRQDPLFKTPFSNLHLQDKSPALNSGVELGIPFNRDKDGKERPYNESWDMGCYQNSN